MPESRVLLGPRFRPAEGAQECQSEGRTDETGRHIQTGTHLAQRGLAGHCGFTLDRLSRSTGCPSPARQLSSTSSIACDFQTLAPTKPAPTPQGGPWPALASPGFRCRSSQWSRLSTFTAARRHTPTGELGGAPWRLCREPARAPRRGLARGQAGAVSAYFPSSSALPTPPSAPTQWGPWSKSHSHFLKAAVPAQVPLAPWPTRPVARHLPAAMGSHQDFRSLQAKFQASQPGTSEQPQKPPKPEVNKPLKKFPLPELNEHPKKPQPEFSAVPRKPPQPEFAGLPKKPPQPEFADLPKKPLQPDFAGLPKKPPQPEFTDRPRKPLQPDFADLPKKPLQPEFADLSRKPPQPEFAGLPKKPPQPEVVDLSRKPPQPEFTDLPKKPSKPESSELSKKFPQLEATLFPRKALQPAAGEAPQKALQPEPSALAQKPPQPELSNPARPPSEPKFSAFPRKVRQPEPNEATPKPSQPEFNANLRKPPQLQVGGLPKKSLLQPEFSEVPQAPPWKPESSEPHPHSSQPDLSALPKKPPQPQLSDLPKKPPQPEFGDLSRTSSEPEVSALPKRPRQSDFKPLSKKRPQPEHGGLPRTSSEPEFSLLPRNFLQVECRGPPRKFSQPETSALLKKRPQPEFFGDLPRKPLLPGSVSESSLPTAVAGGRPRFPLSPGFGARQQRPGALTPSGGSRLSLKPRRRPLPSVSSLGPPPAKPPLPPGPRDVQSFRRPSAAATAPRRTPSSAGTLFQARQPADLLQARDEIYEVYDDVESADDSSTSHKDRDEVPSTQQSPRRPPQDPELRKEKGPQEQQMPAMDPKVLKQIRKAEKAEREFRKKFKFEGEIVIQTRMMIDPNAKTRRGGGKHLGIRRGEILEVIEFTNKDEMLCRDTKGKYGYVPRTALLPLETEVYDDVGFWDPLESQPLPRGR
nr:PML-RARA-regulated adapter molecule 1 [Equus caballus]